MSSSSAKITRHWNVELRTRYRAPPCSARRRRISSSIGERPPAGCELGAAPGDAPNGVLPLPPNGDDGAPPGVGVDGDVLRADRADVAVGAGWPVKVLPIVTVVLRPSCV